MKRTLLAAVLVLAAIPAAPAHAGVRTITLTSRAFRLGGFQTALPKVPVRAPGVDGYLTGMNAILVDRRGRPVSLARVMLHHIVFINHGAYSRQYRGSCAGRWGEPFYGTGEEHQRLILPPGYGYRLGRRDRWRMQAMLMSHALQGDTVRVAYTMTIVTGAAARRMLHVKPLWIRANGCASKNPSYTIDGGGPPGSVSSLTYTWRVPVSGRLGAAGGHLHAGGVGLTLTDPSCGDRSLVDSRPLYAPASDLVYRIRPILHEPGPISTTYLLSKTGISVRRGQILKLTGSYDGQYPRARVMAIMHLYVVPLPDRPAAPRCPPLPPDIKQFWLRKGATTTPPYERVPLNALGPDGQVHAISTLAGPARVFDGDATVDLRNWAFSPSRVSIPAGSTLTWRFDDPVGHNVLYASGPRVVGSATHSHGQTQSQRFDTPGTYQLFCYLHPIQMHQEVVVRPR